MTDETPRPQGPADPAPAPPTAANGPATGPAHGPAPVAGAPWWDRRVPLLMVAAALLLGCLLGGAIGAVGALVAGGGHRGDDRMHGDRYERPGRSDHRYGDRDRPPPPPPGNPAAPPSSPAAGPAAPTAGTTGQPTAAPTAS